MSERLYSFIIIKNFIAKSLFNETVVKEYDLVCERKSSTILFIVFFNIGLTFGPIISGKISETLGTV